MGRSIRTAVALAAVLLLVTPAPGDASWYGSGRFRAVEVRYDTEHMVVVVQAYLGESTQIVVDRDEPLRDHTLRFVCAQVYTNHGADGHCGDGEVAIDWPLLETARVRATIGSIDIDLSIAERGRMHLGPLAATGLPPFAHVGVTAFRPSTATGSVSSDVGSVSGETTLGGLYELTSAYGTF